MAIYETVVILDSLLPPKEIDDLVEHFTKVIAEHGGKVRTVDKWGKRRLSYEIQKKQYGFYFAIEFEGDGNIPLVLQSEYNFNDNVIRYLTYKYDKHKIKSMVEKPVEIKTIAAEVADEPVKESAKSPEIEDTEEAKDEQES